MTTKYYVKNKLTGQYLYERKGDNTDRMSEYKYGWADPCVEPLLALTNDEIEHIFASELCNGILDEVYDFDGLDELKVSEMTVSDIEKLVGHKVKIVKEDER